MKEEVRSFGYAVLLAFTLKAGFRIYGEFFGPLVIDAAEADRLARYAIMGTAFNFLILGYTSYQVAKKLNWKPWQCWLTALGCANLQWIAWVMYFVFKKKMLAPSKSQSYVEEG